MVIPTAARTATAETDSRDAALATRRAVLVSKVSNDSPAPIPRFDLGVARCSDVHSSGSR